MAALLEDDEAVGSGVGLSTFFRILYHDGACPSAPGVTPLGLEVLEGDGKDIEGMVRLGLDVTGGVSCCCGGLVGMLKGDLVAESSRLDDLLSLGSLGLTGAAAAWGFFKGPGRAVGFLGT